MRRSWYLESMPAWIAWTLFVVLGLVAIGLTRRLDDRDR
jgi:hypothetical protein